jgi:hypothetical protein
VEGIIDVALKWLTNNKSEPSAASIAHEHIIENLLAEIRRLEAANVKITEQARKLAAERELEVKRATAEECAVICETALDYAVRNYGCALEIRRKFGLIH